MSYYPLISIMPKTAYDPDAQAFITAAVITNVTQQGAINTLVLALKGYSIWTKFKAIWPILGGTASQHKFNLKDPRDLDAAFRLTFTTGWTHSANGMTPLVASANTFLNAKSVLTQNSTHISYYSRTNSNGAEVEMGGLSGGTQLLLEIRTSNVTYFVVNMGGSYPTYSDTDSRAFYVGNRTASNVINGWKNGVKVASNTTASTTPPNFNLFLGAYNNGAGLGLAPTTKQCAFASIGDGLTDAESANFYTAVQAYQTTLSRQV
jgi:hypothetical protein